MYDATSQNAIANWKRKSQIEHLLEWAAQKPLPVKIGGAADLFCVYRESKHKNRIVLGLANFSNDPAEHFTLTVPMIHNLAGCTKRSCLMIPKAGQLKKYCKTVLSLTCKAGLL